MKKSIYVIVGPNASGKSELGVKIASKVNGEIISADSRQIYRGLNIGSGKVEGKWKSYSRLRILKKSSREDMRGSFLFPRLHNITLNKSCGKVFVYKNVPHYCIDIADPKKVFSAYDFQKCAQSAILDILSRGKTPIIVGGTGFYIDAALGRINLSGVPPNQKLRKKLKNYSTIKLFNHLTKLDPERAKTIDAKNPVRLIRAIEIAKAEFENSSLKLLSSLALNPPSEASGGSDTHTRTEKLSPIRKFSNKRIVWLGIKRNPEELKKRIRDRLLRRLPRITSETKRLRKNGLSWKRMYDLGLEYRYASLYLRKKLTRIEMLETLESEINKYAKRQMTYFKRNKKIRWIAPKRI
ncbi:hypothetical protein HYS99_01045 [Candidatus Giovannonibacteria bacterium]|nr:hypothetical protein [Candidatus Giovannonibacteria bacterium]